MQQLADGVSLLRVVGDLDLDALPALGDTLRAATTPDAWIIVDLAQAGTVDSVALSMLLATSHTARRIGGDLVLTGVSATMHEVLTVARLDSHFRVFETVPQALTAALA